MADLVTSQTIQDGARVAILKFTNVSDGTGESADLDYRDFSGIPNNAGGGKTGDIVFTTTGAASGDAYSIVMTLNKTYT